MGISSKRRFYRFLFLAAPAVLGLPLFQNCSDVQFKAGDGSTVKPADIKPLTEVFEVSGTPQAQKADFLFVVDESVSMESILDNLRAGITSISSRKFPKNTLMAVTNTAPAEVGTETAARPTPFVQIDPSSGSIADYPGFLQLVSGETLARFLSSGSAAQKKLDGRFRLPGCQAWFQPNELNSGGRTCLEAAMQIALTPTLVEAGIVALSQTVRRHNQMGKKLFRDGSLLNVVFISDTHDSGENYYGLSRAEPAPLSPATLNANISSQHQLTGIRFSAIAPVPEVGHPQAAGLRIIGPQDPDGGTFNSDVRGGEAAVGASLNAMRSFRYMDFVRASGGVAIDSHLTSNWGPALEQLIDVVTVVEDPVVTLSKPAAKLLTLRVDGVKFDLVGDLGRKFEVISKDTIRFLNYRQRTSRLVIEVHYLPES